ncbi:MAG: EAL domain-containing protein [Burkholderiales bacterium]
MLKFFRYSSFVGLVAVIAVTVALSWFYRRLAFDALVETETRANVALTKAFANSIWPSYAGFVGQAGTISPADLPRRDEIPRLHRDLKLLARGLDVVKVKIYDTSGLTVFSTDARQIGQDKRTNPGFVRARAGTAASEITFRDHFDAWESEITDRNIIATYVPVRIWDAAPVEAVMEVYSDVTPLVAKLERTQAEIIAGVIGALSLLYALMLWMGGRADRILREQEAQRVANEERIRYQAYHDPLTGLPNRASFVEHLEEAIRRSKRFGWSLGLMFLDLDRFKRVNDSLGHEAGDELLRIAARRLQGCIRESDMLFRMGGDEFTVLLENIKGPEEAAMVAARMIQALAEPVELKHHELAATVSIGIAVYPKDDETGERLVKSADTAMYRAKELGRNRYAFFTGEMNERVERQLLLEAGLQRALRNDEFVLHYQPRVSAATRRVVGVEALARWNHPEEGLVPPGDFIPLLEESGLIVPVGAWVIAAACRQNKAWQDAGLPPMRVSVNISSRQFRSESLDETIREALRASGLDAQWLEVELTESLLVENSEHAVAVMERLKAIGVAISIDDFGTGYSSLGYLKRFPIDCLKIDRSFVQDLRTSATDAAIVDAISALAHSLGLGLVAEGVEDAGQAEFLRARYCTELQGYLFSRPLPADAVADAVRRLGSAPERLAATA